MSKVENLANQLHAACDIVAPEEKWAVLVAISDGAGRMETAGQGTITALEGLMFASDLMRAFVEPKDHACPCCEAKVPAVRAALEKLSEVFRAGLH